MAGSRHVNICHEYGWSAAAVGGLQVHFAGREASVRAVVEALGEQPDIDAAASALSRQPGHFALVVEGPDWVLAATDRLRSYPLFYTGEGDLLRVGQNPRALAREAGLQAPDGEAVLEMRMAGYVTGSDTVLRGLSQMRAGEVFLQSGDQVQKRRYYEFYSSDVRSDAEDDLIQELDALTDDCVRRNMEDAAGRTIWVPLSGGLDSRLVLCKLVQLGYDDVRTYSYGTPGNADARHAKHIADKLGVPWDHVFTMREQARSFFSSKDRRRYWEFADGLHVVPNLHGMFALRYLLDSGKMREGDVVINGQSGDFIAGQHIPAVGGGQDMRDALYSAILNKHYNMRASLLRHPHGLQLANRRIDAVLGKAAAPATEQEYAKVYELWEWQERQSKRVANGQRNYDFLGLRWELPLWEREQYDFWEAMPLEHKRGRRLFVRYVERLDFFGLFKNYRPTMSRWPQGRGGILFVGRMLKALGLSGLSRAWYGRMERRSQYEYLYACIQDAAFRRHWTDYKGPLAYFTDVWLHENLPGTAS